MTLRCLALASLAFASFLRTLPPTTGRLPLAAYRPLGSRTTVNVMYAWGRSLHGLLWRPMVLLALGFFKRSSYTIAAAKPTVELTVETKVFSQQWVEEYGADDMGCALGRGSYTWRGCGFGSNINHLLNAWVYALGAEGWSDLSVIVDDHQLREVECSHESKGLVSHGWACVFSSMPHLCVFNTPELWHQYMNSSGVSDEDQTEATWFSLNSIANADFKTPLKMLNIDQLGAKAVMAKVLWSKMTPWFRQDVHLVAHTREKFQRAPFIGIHIRRGDKIRQNSDLWQDAEAYLAAALSYLDEVPTRTPAENIKGIWVASDNETVVDEVRSLAHAYFPSVLSEDVVYVAGGVPGGVQLPDVTTVSMKQVYASFVYLMADFEQLAAANVFVGTFSSNVGRLVMLLREGAGKPRSSCISLDRDWTPNRHRSLRSLVLD